jgi:hypothetical protein
MHGTASLAQYGNVVSEAITMKGKTFLNSGANGETDIVSILLSLLDETDSTYCVIGGLGVIAYAKPVVSLDLGLVVLADRIVVRRQSAGYPSRRGVGVPRRDQTHEQETKGPFRHHAARGSLPGTPTRTAAGNRVSSRLSFQW